MHVLASYNFPDDAYIIQDNKSFVYLVCVIQEYKKQEILAVNLR